MASGRWASEAARNAAVKYAPQSEALREALQNARETYGSTLRAGNAQARLSKQAINEAYGPTRAAYTGAEGRQAQDSGLVSAALAKLTGNDLYKTEQATEAANAASRTTGRRAADESRLAQNKVAAQEGAQFGAQNARSVLERAVQQIIGKGQALSAQQGADAQVEAGRLEREAEKLQASAAQNREDNLTSRANAQEGNAVKQGAYSYSHGGSHGSKSGGGFLPQLEQTKAASTLRDIEGEARHLREHGTSRSQILQSLVTASEGALVRRTTVNPKTGKTEEVLDAKEKPTYEKTKGVPARDRLLTEAALDSVFGYGHVSEPVVQKLHAAGYRVSALGLVPTKNYRQAPENVGGVKGGATNKPKKK